MRRTLLKTNNSLNVVEPSLSKLRIESAYRKKSLGMIKLIKKKPKVNEQIQQQQPIAIA